MKGPYEYWNQSDNDFLAGECHKGQGRPFASLPGITSMADEFRAVAALLNNAPALISAARENLRLRGLLYEVYDDGLKTNMKQWRESVNHLLLDSPKDLPPPAQTQLSSLG